MRIYACACKRTRICAYLIWLLVDLTSQIKGKNKIFLLKSAFLHLFLLLLSTKSTQMIYNLWLKRKTTI